MEPYSEEITVIMNTVIWFLEKLALRGELTWSNKEIPLEEHLRIFEDMITGYFDRLIEARTARKTLPFARSHNRLATGANGLLANSWPDWPIHFDSFN